MPSAGKNKKLHKDARVNAVYPRCVRPEVRMDKTIPRLNIEHFHKLLLTEVDDTRRAMLLRLLAEEETKFAAFAVPPHIGSAG
jgi:hypothetical protein